MSWIEFLDNPMSIRSIYDSDPDIIEIFEITLGREGPILKMKALVNNFPDKPPKKWLVHQSNRVLVELSLFGLQTIEIHQWSTNNVGTFEIGRMEKGTLRFVFSGENTDIRGEADILLLAGFKHYLEKDT